MTAAKTTPTEASVAACIAARAKGSQVADCEALLALLGRLTGEPPRMWGPSIVGFGTYQYRHESGRTGESCLTGFAIRGADLVVYLAEDAAGQAGWLQQLGKHKAGKACLYFKRLADLDLRVLEQLVSATVQSRRGGG
jgi:hypothetical protein